MFPWIKTLVWAVVFAASLLACNTGKADSKKPTAVCTLRAGEHRIQVGGDQRVYTVAIGSKARRGRAPLLFLWHGFGAYRPGFVDIIGDRDWPAAIRVAPKGMPRTFPQFGDRPRLGWQIAKDEFGDRDLQFFDAMLKKLGEGGCIDRKRVFSSGFSNGGFFSHLLGCYRSEHIAAIAPVGGGGPFGPMVGPEPGPARCGGTVPALVHHGTEDEVVPYLLAREAFSFWSKHNGCGRTPPAADACRAAPTCRAPVQLCSSARGHRWPAGASRRIVAFFSTPR